MSFERARSGQTHAVWWLEIDGYHRVFYSGPTAPTLDPEYTATPGLMPPSRVTARADLMEATSRPATCSVRVGRVAGVDIQDLRRRAPDGATRMVTLASTVAQGVAGPYTISVNEDVSAWPVTGVLWIGQEAMFYVARDVGLRTFTVTGLGRGTFGSQVGEHVADTAEGWAPRIYSECVSWRNRRARIWADELLSDGTLAGEPRCEIDGWLRDGPADVGGSMYEVQLTSVSAALDLEVGADQLQTGLQHGWHAFDGENAHELRWSYSLATPFDTRATIASAAGGGAILGVAWVDHFNTFDPAQSDERAGFVEVGGNTYQLAAAPYVGVGWDGTGSLNIVGVLAANIAIGDRVRVSFAVYSPRPSVLTAAGVEEVVEWPGDSLNRLFSALAPGTYLGAGGLWADAAYDDAGQTIRFTSNTIDQPSPFLASTGPLAASVCVGLCIGDDLPVVEPGRENPGWVVNAAVDAVQRVGFEIRGAAAAWHSRSEKYIHAADDVFSTPSVASPIWVKASFISRGEPTEYAYQIVGKKLASTVTVGSSGVLLEKSASQIGRGYPLSDWPGQPDVTLHQAIRWREASPTRIMLELLMSSTGAGYTSATYDVLPFGVGLENTQVDIGSFERYAVPSGAGARRTFEMFEGVEIGTMLSDLARSIGAVITERLDQSTGRRRIALVRAGMPIATDATADIGNGRWQAASRPHGADDIGAVNSVAASLNWELGEPALTVTVNDRDLQKEDGRTQLEELALHGVIIRAASVSSQRAEILPIAAERFAMFGNRRIIISGGLSYSDALLLDPGAVVTFSAAEVEGYDGVRGLSDAVGIVQSISRDPAKQRASVELVYWGARVAGWAPALEIIAAPTPTTLTVAANSYTETTDPVTGAALTDASLFTNGDAVNVVPLGDWPNRVATTITLAGTTVTTAAPHGIAGPDFGTIRPQSYDAVSAAIQLYAFAADDAGTLGAAAVAAYVYA